MSARNVPGKFIGPRSERLFEVIYGLWITETRNPNEDLKKCPFRDRLFFRVSTCCRRAVYAERSPLGVFNKFLFLQL